MLPCDIAHDPNTFLDWLESRLSPDSFAWHEDEVPAQVCPLAMWMRETTDAVVVRVGTNAIEYMYKGVVREAIRTPIWMKKVMHDMSWHMVKHGEISNDMVKEMMYEYIKEYKV